MTKMGIIRDNNKLWKWRVTFLTADTAASSARFADSRRGRGRAPSASSASAPAASAARVGAESAGIGAAESTAAAAAETGTRRLVSPLEESALDVARLGARVELAALVRTIFLHLQTRSEPTISTRINRKELANKERYRCDRRKFLT